MSECYPGRRTELTCVLQRAPWLKGVCLGLTHLSTFGIGMTRTRHVNRVAY